jgi:hypothetical protein
VISEQEGLKCPNLEMHQTRLPHPFHCRVSPDLSLPSDLLPLWHGNIPSPVLTRVAHGSSNRVFLRLRGHGPLLVASNAALGPNVQEHPQTTPRVQFANWSGESEWRASTIAEPNVLGCRVCPPSRSLDSCQRYPFRPIFLLLAPK